MDTINKDEYKRELELWESIFDDSKRHPLSDFLHKYHNITMCLRDRDSNRKTSSSMSKFCHTMMHNPKSAPICQGFCQELTSNPHEDIEVKICPLGIINVIAPIRYKDHIIASVVCDNMILKDGFVPDDVCERYHLKPVTSDDINKLKEFMTILSNLVHLPELKISDAPKPTENSIFAGLGLTGREQEIATLIIKGYTNKRISEELYITEATVKTHVSSILSKLDVEDRMQLIKKYGSS